jgi:MFS family permease
VGEFRALFSAQLLSVAGDQLAKVAVAILVFDRTASPLLTAVAFGISYLPWLVGGPFLAALADRFPRRRVMVSCDLVRAGLVGLLALPGLPLAAILGLLFAAALLQPPFDAARSASTPDIVTGDIYVVANGILNMVGQAAQVVGFATGGLVVAALSPRGALLTDALTFAASALILSFGLRFRPVATPPTRQSVWADTVGGARLILGNRPLLYSLLLVWLSCLFVYGPEGIMAPYAQHLHGGSTTVGLLLASGPLGLVAGQWLISRLFEPDQRVRLVRPLAIVAVLLLVPVLMDPPGPVVGVLLALSGMAMAFSLPINALFVQGVPPAYRGRAFGVAAFGIYLSQGAGLVITGLVANVLSPPHVVGLVGLVGTVVIVPVALRWVPPAPAVEAVAVPSAGAPTQGTGGRHRATAH